MQTALWMDGFMQAYGTSDEALNAVLVFRHEAVAMMLDDAMWARLAITTPSGNVAPGNTQSSPSTDASAAPGRNPWLGVSAPGTSPGPQGTDYTISALRARGVILLACNIALRGQVSRLRQKESLPEADAQQAIRNAVVPGCYIVPNGIFGVSRAQLAGCAYFAPG